MLYTIIVVVALLTYVIVSHAGQFAKQVWEYKISETFNGRIVESIVAAREVRDVVYISFSEQVNKKCSNGTRNGAQERVNCNPLVAKILFKGEAVVEWSTSLTDFKEDTRFTSLSLSLDGRRLYVTGTLMNAGGGDKFYVESIDTRYGVATGVMFMSELAGSQIVRSSAVDENGVYFCGRTSNDGRWEFLLGQISFSGSLLWRYEKKMANITCDGMDISGGYVYTVGTTRAAVIAGVMHKHSRDGDIVWGKRIRSTADLALRAVEVLGTREGVMMSSVFEASHEPRDRVIVQKVSEGGTLLWTREMGTGGVLRGMGYCKGFVYVFVGRGDGGLGLGRVDRFGDGVDEMVVEVDSGVEKRSVWAGVDEVVTVVSGKFGMWGYGVGISGGDGVADSGSGRFGYIIKATVVVDENDVGMLGDYLHEMAHGGKVAMEQRDSGVGVAITVRGDDVATLDGIAKRVMRGLETGADGRNEVAEQLGIEVVVVDRDISVAGSREGFEGVRSSLGVGVGLAVSLGVLMGVVVVWYCAVSKS